MSATIRQAAAALLGFVRELRLDSRGNAAMITALTAVPLVGAGGLALDYNRALNAKAFLQQQVDEAAINAAASGPRSDAQRWLRQAREATLGKYRGSASIQSLNVSGSWVASNRYTATATADVPVLLFRIMPGAPDTMRVEVSATAQVTDPIYIYEKPTVTDLDPEAADYNRISVYCFDAKAKAEGQSASTYRKNMTVIADNGGTRYTYTMPTCAPGEVMSYQLENVRGMRTTPRRWDDPRAERYTYHTDTSITNGVEAYDLGGWDILETVLCDSLAACRDRSRGGVIPTGKNRVPERATQACATGKFMYYGWEDRPPGRGWTDRDYDDIRVVISCPSVRRDGDKLVRLVS